MIENKISKIVIGDSDSNIVFLAQMQRCKSEEIVKCDNI